MASTAPIYDLTLLLATSAPEERRAKILQDVESAISSDGGSLERNDDWGTRGLAFRIAHKTDAEYHLLQFSGPPSLLESLSHSLRIADDVLRFRIIKVLPGTPPAPDSPPPIIATALAPSPASAAAQSASAADTAPPEQAPAEVATEEPSEAAEDSAQAAAGSATEAEAGSAEAPEATATEGSEASSANDGE